MLLDISDEVIERIIVWFCRHAIATLIVVNGITAIAIINGNKYLKIVLWLFIIVRGLMIFASKLQIVL